VQRGKPRRTHLGQAKWSVIAVVAALSFSLTACGSTTTTISSGGTTVKVSHHGGHSTVKVKNKKGSVQINTGTQLPPHFPRAVPLPAGLTLSQSLATSAGQHSGFDLIYDVTGSMRQAVNRYDAALRAAGFTMDASYVADGNITQAWHSSAWKLALVGEAAQGSSAPASISLVITKT
jgi:predicted small secreted protein